jgi:hypothetical protein
MNSGIEIGDDVLGTYKALALKRASRYIIMKPSDDGTKIELEKVGAREETFD